MDPLLARTTESVATTVPPSPAAALLDSKEPPVTKMWLSVTPIHVCMKAPVQRLQAVSFALVPKVTRANCAKMMLTSVNQTHVYEETA